MTDDVIVTDAPKKKAKRLVLDNDRPFCTVHGAPGVSYYQDGEYFDSRGDRVVIDSVE